jgi:arabinoxylan arabinofuranohydrolase
MQLTISKPRYLKTILLASILIACQAVLGQNLQQGLKLHYDFKSSNNNSSLVEDISGNGYHGSLKNNATCSTSSDIGILDLGNQNGYVDMGANTGTLITSLEDFSIAVNLYIDPTSNITGAGNFVWAFSTREACTQTQGQYIAYRVNQQRYAQSSGGWSRETVGIQKGSAARKGEWEHVVYVQNGNTGSIYINGELLASGAASLQPKDMVQSPAYNWIGRPHFSGDAYLKNASLSDFRIYNRALTLSEINQLTTQLETLNSEFALQTVQEAYDALTLENTNQVRNDLSLPNIIHGRVQVNWSSDNPEYLSNTGKVTRPAFGSSPIEVVLTATLSFQGQSLQKTFHITILAALDDQTAVTQDINALNLEDRCFWLEQIDLPDQGAEGSSITWVSDNPEFLRHDGKIVQLPAKGNGDLKVNMTATVSSGTHSQTRDFTVCINEDEGYTAYLFAYFTGNSGIQESIRFAISRDGLNYKTLNNNLPVIGSDTISHYKAVRDPHILRSEDGHYFYMVVTDMKSDLGWNSNHGMVLLKSTDLIHWTHNAIDIKTRFPAFSTINRAWAPQTIYDPDEGKYMVYWSMRSGSNKDVIYYAYTNPEFTDFVSEPAVLFNHATSTIDGDIIYKEGKYHMFFKTEGSGNGIKIAVSDYAHGPFIVEEDKYVQQTSQAVEGSCAYKLINSNTYILMYDMYTSGRYQFTQSTDLSNFSIVDDGSMDFAPRHGTTIPITEEEADRLMQTWGASLPIEILDVLSPAVKKDYWILDGNQIFLPVDPHTDLSSFNPQFQAWPGTSILPAGARDFSKGSLTYNLNFKGQNKQYNVKASIARNPVLQGFYADPDIIYSHKTNKYYLYPTSDGYPGWGGYNFKVFSSDDLTNWQDEGVILDMSTDQVSWADGNAWAPAIIEKKVGDDDYRYYFYYSGNPTAGGGKQIGVAVANHPTGPFTDLGQAMITSSPTGSGQQIDPCVFEDPVSGKFYIYWGNGYLAGAELNDDMVSIKAGTTQVMTPAGGTLSTHAYREGAYVIYRNGLYYFLWSVDDTGSPNYHVAYGTATSPLGNITVSDNPIILAQDANNYLYGTGHNSVLQIPGKDEWYFVYHRINSAYLNNGPGYHREVCIDKLEFGQDGSILRTIPSWEGVQLEKSPNAVSPTKTNGQNWIVYPNPTHDVLNVETKFSSQSEHSMTLYSMMGNALKNISCNASGKTQLNISEMPKGMYLLSWFNGQETLNQIVFKN